MIPKVIYQTWKTKELHPVIKKIQQNIQRLNPDYKMEMFDDNDMDDWIISNCDADVIQAYNKLYVGAAKADLYFFRESKTTGKVVFHFLRPQI